MRGRKKPNAIIQILIWTGILVFGIFMMLQPDQFYDPNREPTGRRRAYAQAFRWVMEEIGPRPTGAIVAGISGLALLMTVRGMRASPPDADRTQS